MNAQNLDKKQQSMVAISANTAVGNMSNLNIAVNQGLDNGLTINEIKEAMVQLYAYCGFPRSLNALNTLKTVVDERKTSGKKDVEGKAGNVENKVTDKYEQGRKTLEILSKTPQQKPAPGFGEFAPRIDNFLKEHLFADIFANDVLDAKQRELVTISALAAMEGTEGQLKAHIGMGKNTGITDDELKTVADIIGQNISQTRANTVLRNIGLPEKNTIQPDILVRIAEIEVYPQYRDEYLKFAKEIAKNSVGNEPGVISVFPMQVKENPNLIRIMEIYEDKKAYDAHIASANFQKYKTSTPQMIKDLKLVDMNMITPENLAKVFRKTNQTQKITAMNNEVPKISEFPTGQSNDAYAQYFSGKSWLAPLTQIKELNVPISNVTFEPGCRNNWHKHSGGQILICVGGEGYYQERGKAAQKLKEGDIVEIAPNIEHWHGAAPDSWFSHLAIACNPQTNENTWLEPVSDEEYNNATSN